MKAKKEIDRQLKLYELAYEVLMVNCETEKAFNVKQKIETLKWVLGLNEDNIENFLIKKELNISDYINAKNLRANIDLYDYQGKIAFEKNIIYPISNIKDYSDDEDKSFQVVLINESGREHYITSYDWLKYFSIVN